LSGKGKEVGPGIRSGDSHTPTIPRPVIGVIFVLSRDSHTDSTLLKARTMPKRNRQTARLHQVADGKRVALGRKILQSVRYRVNSVARRFVRAIPIHALFDPAKPRFGLAEVGSVSPPQCFTERTHSVPSGGRGRPTGDHLGASEVRERTSNRPRTRSPFRAGTGWRPTCRGS
jgi:hypothetical protein